MTSCGVCLLGISPPSVGLSIRCLTCRVAFSSSGPAPSPISKSPLASALVSPPGSPPTSPSDPPSLCLCCRPITGALLELAPGSPPSLLGVASHCARAGASLLASIRGACFVPMWKTLLSDVDAS
ncbi:hypothetical protein SUGI_0632320 [Cryptomeria japonica]|nr:hypothetical protein SUGI_0632320 [Cryptomeria japonica]